MLGFVNVQVEIADSPRQWTHVVVVDQPQQWELLVSNKLLKELDIELVMPTVHKCQKGKMGLTQIQSVTDNGAPIVVPTQSVTNNDYRDLLGPQDPKGYVIDTLPTGFLTDADAEAMAESRVSEGKSIVKLHKMRVRLRVPLDYFKQEHNADFMHWNATYLVVSQDEVSGCIMHQLESIKDVKMLLDQLMSGTDALHDYLSGCLLPAAM
ncbi:hypothetical protein FBU31_000813 [Coemansia sp. 'formosensis']|nr:hypothetical protein FBU31_000813 [Coemansia sp. 'formosensis']